MCLCETSSANFFAVLSRTGLSGGPTREGPFYCRRPLPASLAQMGGVLQVGGKEHMFDQRFKSDRPGIKAPAPASNAPATTEFGTHATTTVAIVDEAKVHELTSLSRTTRWRMERRGEFPKRIRLSAGRVGWRQADIEAWIRSRTA